MRLSGLLYNGSSSSASVLCGGASTGTPTRSNEVPKKRGHYQRRKNAQVFTAAPATAPKQPAPAPQRKTRIQYDKPFILLEDANKDTFEFKAGQWVRHSMTIAECRETCLVKELPQKVNGMTRYEIRNSMSADE
jgi:hypothetical protein